MELFEMIGPAGLQKVGAAQAGARLGTEFRLFSGNDPKTGFPTYRTEKWRFSSASEQARFERFLKTGSTPPAPKAEPKPLKGVPSDPAKPKTEGIEKG